jgi:hypothetical protein
MNLQKELLRNVQFVFSTLSCSARAQMTDLPFPKNLVIDEGNTHMYSYCNARSAM